MLTHFICPNRTKTSIKQCLEKCPFDERCAPLSFLKMCADERIWNGKPSVTQLLRGTREAYLKIEKDYAENPQDQVFKIIGSKGHLSLEKYGLDPEHPLEFEGITGIPDEIENEGDEYTMIDYKTSGSYKVAQVIGMIAVETGEVGPRGKAIKRYEIDSSSVNWGDWQLQFNMYRIMIEAKIGITIKKIKAFLPVRDGNTSIAKSRGIDKNFYYVEVPFLEVDDVLKYFRKKRDALLEHLKIGTLPPPCTPEEAWNGNKCKGYCSVVEHCENCPYI